MPSIWNIIRQHPVGSAGGEYRRLCWAHAGPMWRFVPWNRCLRNFHLVSDETDRSCTWYTYTGTSTVQVYSTVPLPMVRRPIPHFLPLVGIWIIGWPTDGYLRWVPSGESMLTPDRRQYVNLCMYKSSRRWLCPNRVVTVRLTFAPKHFCHTVHGFDQILNLVIWTTSTWYVCLCTPCCRI
jgi:hypothetical protein